MSDGEISVVIPVFNERDNLRPLLDALVPVLEGLQRRFEVLLVDDGSRDGSAELLDELAAADGRLRVLHFDRNNGQSAALDCGFQNSVGSIIVTLDADLQVDPADIPEMLRTLADNGAVVGIRQRRRDTWWRRFSSRFANGVRNRLTREEVEDTGCPLKVLRAEALANIPRFNGMHRFLPTLLRLEGYRVVQLPVRHRSRHAGESKYGTWDRAFRGLRDTLGVRWLQDRHLNWRLRP
jgi:dolichol-phosphate mannosyltransferase